MPKKPVDDSYSEQEAQLRFMAALKAAVNTPPKPLKNKRPSGVATQRKRRKKSKATA